MLLPANSFDAHFLFDRGTGLPGKVSVTRTISLPSVTSQVTSIKCHTGMSEGQRSHTALQALKNNRDGSASLGKSSSVTCLPTPGHLLMRGQVVDAPAMGDVPAAVLHPAGYWGC